METVLLFLAEIFLYPSDASKGRKRYWIGFGCYLLVLALLAIGVYLAVKHTS